MVSRTLRFFGLSTLGGVLLGVGFVVPVLWWLWFFGCVVLLLLYENITTRKEAVLVGWWVFFIKSLFAISWFWSTYPIEWIDLALGPVEPLVVGWYWVTVALFLSGGGMLFGVGWYVLMRRLPLVVQPILFAFLIVVSEVAGSIFFSVGTLGPGSTINTVFSFGYSGYLLAEHAGLLLFARVAGVYGLTVLAGVLGWLGWYGLCTKKNIQHVLLISILIVVGMGAVTVVGDMSMQSPMKRDVLVSVIDTKFSGQALSEAHKKTQVAEAVFAALALGSTYIILPEDSRFFNPEASTEAVFRQFRFMTGDTETIVLDSGRLSRGEEAVLRATIYDGVAKKTWVTDKQYLVPQGEFMPHFYMSTLSLVGLSDAATAISAKLSYRPGPEVSQAEFAAHIPAVLFCFESADPWGVRRLRIERSVPFVAHPVSHAWFHESKILWQQLDAMLRVQAVWNQVNIVSAGNMAIGALYTPTGQKIQPTPAKTGPDWTVSTLSF